MLLSRYLGDFARPICKSAQMCAREIYCGRATKFPVLVPCFNKANRNIAGHFQTSISEPNTEISSSASYSLYYVMPRFVLVLVYYVENGSNLQLRSI